MNGTPGRSRVLLAEDDPVSREYLSECVRACGAHVVACSHGGDALARARDESFSLLLLDHHLPGLDGDQVLAALRADPGAASRDTPAIATSAARNEHLEGLLQAGFLEVLSKPMDAGDLRSALRRHGCVARAMLLDDADAVRACGSPQSLARLRRLFAEQELPRIGDELERLAGDPQGLRPLLHRLRASCGFCGAQALADASAALHRALATGATASQIEARLGVFRDALAETRVALHARLGKD